MKKKSNKRCPRCKLTKKISEFGIASTSSDGHRSYCRSCYNFRKKFQRHGITEEEYITIRLSTSACEICGAVVKLVIDHDHNTGLVRGMLCTGCNYLLGIVKDNQEILLKAVEYLQRKPPWDIISDHHLKPYN